ncbi:MAG: putative peptide zinc metalloprotease protein [Verrucomicrobiales bacterium]|jgi:putative peptide zinc metalloprotease protein
MADLQTFSESWYRVANQRIHLRAGVVVRRQRFRGDLWMVLENPLSNQFFRLRPEAYALVGRLRPDRTVGEVWQECLEKFPDDAPGQEAVIQLLSQLYHANLLQYSMASDSRDLFERFKKRRQREVRARLTNIMFMRFPLLDPDRFLNRTIAVVGKAFSWLGSVLWLLVVGVAMKIVVENFSALSDQTQSVLAPGNLGWLYLSIIVIKVIHEFGHAYACKRYGGEVHVMGVMLLIFTPIPYVDATSSWGFRSRWQRMLVGAAGMIVEIFVAAIATMIWYKTAPGVLHTVCFNVMFIASVSTLLFNINPLLRFDGYYMLSDLVEIPNLHQRSANQLKHLFMRYLYGVKKSESPARSRREKTWLTVFGISSNVYRIVVFSGILLFVADRFLILGLIMVVVCLIGWIITPLCKFIHFLATSPKLDRNRPRAMVATALLLGGLFAFFQFMPFPSHFRAPGILKAKSRTEIYSSVSGTVEEILVESGSQVTEGQPLMRMSNAELDWEIVRAEAAVDEVNAQLLAGMDQDPSLVKPLRAQMDSVAKVVVKLKKQQRELLITAPQAGTWVAPQSREWQSMWLPQGSVLGMLIDPSDYQFSATVQQSDADRLFSRAIEQAEMRLLGQASEVLHLVNLEVIQGDRRQLPSPVLGWQGGGEIQTAVDDPDGRRTAEPFFEVRGDLVHDDVVAALHGRAGKVRFFVGYEPLLPRGIRRLRQLLQKRYQI